MRAALVLVRRHFQDAVVVPAGDQGVAVGQPDGPEHLDAVGLRPVPAGPLPVAQLQGVLPHHLAGRIVLADAPVPLVADQVAAGRQLADHPRVPVRVRVEAGIGGDLVIVPHPQPAPIHPGGVAVIGEGEMVTGLQPAMVGTAEGAEGSDFDH